MPVHHLDVHRAILHEHISVVDDIFALRVPGGWIYEFLDKESTVTSAVFVPYNEELKETE